jgi:branched-chain amino acid transport system substrate-binding protein
MAKIGLLLPHSSLYPSLSVDLTEGLKSGVAGAGLGEVTWAIEGIGFGTDADDLLAKSQKLLLQEGVDLVVGMLPRRMAGKVAPLFTSANRLLLLLDVLGEFFVDPPAPTVFYHSLQTCLSCRLTGRKAVESGATGIIQASSFYDAGYLQGYANAQGVETNGGHMVQYFVSSHVPDQVSLQNLQVGLECGEAQAVVGLYSGHLAEQFYRLYSQLPQPLPLWVAPMMLEEQMLAQVPFPLESVRGFVAWSERLETVANEDFKETIRRRGRRPNLFSLLGFEAGMIVAHHLKKISETGYPTPEVFEQLSTLAFDGPRGRIKFNQNTHYSFGPLYAAAVVPDEKGHCRLANLTPEPTVDKDFAAFQNEPPPLTHTGWHNSYLCI